jgi:hypothetical protein
MLLDRKIDFSKNKEREWNELRSKIGDEGAKKNVRPLTVHNPAIINFQEFVRVAEHYNEFLTPSVSTMNAKLELQRTMLNLRYIFVLIYNLI